MKNIRSRLLKDLSDACGLILGNIWNEKSVLNTNFPENLKLADVTPILKKKDETFVENCRSLSVLPTAYKIFKRIMQNYIGKIILE